MRGMVNLPRVHLPMKRPEDVIMHLGSPNHWQPGRSAKSAADTWFYSNGLPATVSAVLTQDPRFAEAQLVDAFLERAVDLGDGKQPSQTDVMAIVRIGDELAAIAVEAKVDETFGPIVDDWLNDPKGDRASRMVRLEHLCTTLGISTEKAGQLRYQLLHRTASAVFEAKRYCARQAAMLVQSFSPKGRWFDDFAAFVTAMGLGPGQPGTITSSKDCAGVEVRLGWVADHVEGPYKRLGTARTVTNLTDLGRARLSKSFFMRDMLYSEVAMIHGLNNAPDDPDLAIQAGTRLCEELLEPLQDHWGRLAIRSAYRSCEVNAFCNQMQRQNKAGYSCASNEQNYAAHIWDRRDTNGHMGAMACVVVPHFWEQHQGPGDWQILARWIHQNLPYSTLYFFPTYWAVNIGWHERQAKTIKSYADPKGLLKL